MRNLFGVLGNVATVAGKGFEGYGIDKQLAIKKALAQQEAAREAERTRVLNLLTQREVDTPRLGDKRYAPLVAEVEGAKATAEIPAAVAKADALKPIEVSKALEIARGTPESRQAVVTTEHGTGRQVVSSFGTKSGTLTPTGTEAKAATMGRGALSGAALRKAIADNEAQMAFIDQAMAELDANLDAVGLKRGFGSIPGMSKVGEIINQKLDPEGVNTRNKLQNIASVTILDRSGTAVSGKEWERLGFIPDQAYDPESNKKKLQDMKAWAQTETEAMRKQLEGIRSPAAAPTASKPSLQERVAQLKAQGVSKEEARRILRQEGYNP